jgi:hypothetical protein
VLRCANELFVGVVVAEVYVGFLLNDWVVPAVVNPERD